MKRCFKCGKEKQLSEFYRHSMMADGHLNKCKTCTKSDVRRHRSENESVRAYDRQRYAENSQRRKSVQKIAADWRVKNPDRYRAQNKVNNAIRDGKLKKQSCEVCGDKNVHAHHDDYSKPLEVRWLCPLHHHREHAKKGR